MADTIKEQILQAIATRLAIIRTAKGFNSNCGRNVLRAEKKRDSDLKDSVIMWPGMDEASPKYASDYLEFDLVVEAEMEITTNINPSVAGEKLTGDVAEALMSILWALPFTDGGTNTPRGGDVITGETSGATAMIEDVTVSSGTWAGGDAAGVFYLRRMDGTLQDEDVSIGGTTVATLTGVITGQGSGQLSTNNLAEIIYAGGGIDSYPEPSEGTIGIKCVFRVIYKTINGDPYNQ